MRWATRLPAIDPGTRPRPNTVAMPRSTSPMARCPGRKGAAESSASLPASPAAAAVVELVADLTGQAATALSPAPMRSTKLSA